MNNYWKDSEDNRNLLQEIKSKRPLCTDNFPKHTWIDYSGEHKRVCHECGYEEELVYDPDETPHTN